MASVTQDRYLPHPPLPEGQTPESWLRELARQGLIRRYGPHPSPEVVERIAHELAVIEAKRGARYMLIVAEYVTWARQVGIWVGPARGAVSGSAVAFVLGITEVDPVRHGLLFERFLSSEVPSFPDIDVDFEWGRRPDVVEHIAHVYGEDRVAGISTTSNPKRFHAAGLLIANRPLSDVVMLRPIPRSDRGSWLGAEYGCAWADYKSCEQVGLVKFDLLDLIDLRSMRQTVAAIERNHGITISAGGREIPLDDPATFELLCRGDTTGVFQLAGHGIQRYLRVLQPERFDDVVALVALYRPRAMELGIHQTYADRRHGRGSAMRVHPEVDVHLNAILDSTRGVLVFQQQLMELVHLLAGVSLDAAERLRLSLRMQEPTAIDACRSELGNGMHARGYSQKAAEAAWSLIADASDVAFDKGHAVSYALVSYWTAYLKANFPDEFSIGTPHGTRG